MDCVDQDQTAQNVQSDLRSTPSTFLFKFITELFLHLGNGWLVVFGFNATLTAKVMSWRSVTHMCFLAFSHQY